MRGICQLFLTLLHNQCELQVPKIMHGSYAHPYLLYHAQGIAKKRKAIPYISPIGSLLPTTHYFKHSAAEKLVSGTELGESKGGHLKPARDSPNVFCILHRGFQAKFFGFFLVYVCRPAIYKL